MTDADLRYAVLDGTQFTGAFFRNTNLCFSMFLERAIGLDQVQFGGHSYINQAAISAGIAIFPDTFLRGFGYSPAEIAAMRDARSATSLFASCFISYSHADEAFAKKLHDRLVADGVNAWYAPKDILPGRKIHEQLSSAIQRHDKLILVLSQTSMASNWVRSEIRTARIRERAESKQMFFPIRLVPFEAIRTWESFFADDGLDFAQEVREYFIPDFSEWAKRNKFEDAYQLLLRGLRVNA